MITHYSDVIMSAIASQITSLSIVYSTVFSVLDQRKHQSSASLAFVWGIHRSPVNSPHKGPVTRKMFSFEDIIMFALILHQPSSVFPYTWFHIDPGVHMGSRLTNMIGDTGHFKVPMTLFPMTQESHGPQSGNIPP